jgi:hypothetical protein
MVDNWQGESKMVDEQTIGYMALDKYTRLSNFHTHHNAECVVCAALHAEMVRVGAVIFCTGCVQRVFKTDDPVREERETYLKWLHKRDENAKN